MVRRRKKAMAQPLDTTAFAPTHGGHSTHSAHGVTSTDRSSGVTHTYPHTSTRSLHHQRQACPQKPLTPLVATTPRHGPSRPLTWRESHLSMSQYHGAEAGVEPLHRWHRHLPQDRLPAIASAHDSRHDTPSWSLLSATEAAADTVDYHTASIDIKVVSDSGGRPAAAVTRTRWSRQRRSKCRRPKHPNHDVGVGDPGVGTAAQLLDFSFQLCNAFQLHTAQRRRNKRLWDSSRELRGTYHCSAADSNLTTAASPRVQSSRGPGIPRRNRSEGRTEHIEVKLDITGTWGRNGPQMRSRSPRSPLAVS